MDVIRRGVEKLLPAKFAKIKSRQAALQTTFSVFLYILHPPISRCFEENGLFQQPQALEHSNPGRGSRYAQKERVPPILVN